MEPWTLNMPLGWLIVAAAVAIAVAVLSARKGDRYLTAFGILAVSLVMYVGFVWEVWWWVSLIFWIFWIVGLVCAVIFAVTGAGATEWLARMASGVAAAIVIALVVIEGIIYPLMGWNLSVDHENTSGVVITTPSPSPTEPSPTTTTPSTTTPTKSGSSHQKNPCAPYWQVSTATPSNGLWFRVPDIMVASTSHEARAAFVNWYQRALNRTPLSAKLFAFVLDHPVAAASLADANGNCASSKMHQIGLNIRNTLAAADYYPASSSVKVILPSGKSIWVMGTNGQLRTAAPS